MRIWITRSACLQLFYARQEPPRSRSRMEGVIMADFSVRSSLLRRCLDLESSFRIVNRGLQHSHMPALQSLHPSDQIRFSPRRLFGIVTSLIIRIFRFCCHCTITSWLAIPAAQHHNPLIDIAYILLHKPWLNTQLTTTQPPPFSCYMLQE